MFATVTLKTPVADTAAFRSRLLAATAARRRTRRSLGEPSSSRKICPVTHGEARLDGRPDPGARSQGRKVWTCCSACPPKLKAQPPRYLARLDAAAARSRSSACPSRRSSTPARARSSTSRAEPGVFEGREVVLGPRIGDRFPVLEGLAPGEKVAAAGAFLIDAESRLNPAPAAERRASSRRAGDPQRADGQRSMPQAAHRH